MTASSVLLILVGIFVIANAMNLVGVMQGNKKFNLDLGTTATTTTSTSTTKSTSAQTS